MKCVSYAHDEKCLQRLLHFCTTTNHSSKILSVPADIAEVIKWQKKYLLCFFKHRTRKSFLNFLEGRDFFTASLNKQLEEKIFFWKAGDEMCILRAWWKVSSKIIALLHNHQPLNSNPQCASRLCWSYQVIEKISVVFFETQYQKIISIFFGGGGRFRKKCILELEYGV